MVTNLSVYTTINYPHYFLLLLARRKFHYYPWSALTAIKLYLVTTDIFWIFHLMERLSIKFKRTKFVKQVISHARILSVWKPMWQEDSHLFNFSTRSKTHWNDTAIKKRGIHDAMPCIKLFSITCSLIVALDESEKLFDLALRDVIAFASQYFLVTNTTNEQKSLWMCPCSLSPRSIHSCSIIVVCRHLKYTCFLCLYIYKALIDL